MQQNDLSYMLIKGCSTCPFKLLK